MVWVLVLAACSTRSGGRIEAEAVSEWTGDGAAIVVPAEAKIDVTSDKISVDAADGTRWFDVERAPAPVVPAGLRDQWATTTCEGSRWEAPAEPVPGVTTDVGQCTIGNKPWWAFHVVEDRGDHAVVIGYVADPAMPLEDAWVDFVRTAMTATGGPRPLATPSAEDVRKTVRDVAGRGLDHEQLMPGGGVLSKKISEELAPVWAARMAAPPAR